MLGALWPAALRAGRDTTGSVPKALGLGLADEDADDGPQDAAGVAALGGF